MAAATTGGQRWCSLGKDVAKSTVGFVRDPSAVLYLGVAIVLGGAAGIWVPLLTGKCSGDVYFCRACTVIRRFFSRG
jgi:hypothetical protein